MDCTACGLDMGTILLWVGGVFSMIANLGLLAFLVFFFTNFNLKVSLGAKDKKTAPDPEKVASSSNKSGNVLWGVMAGFGAFGLIALGYGISLVI